MQVLECCNKQHVYQFTFCDVRYEKYVAHYAVKD